MAQKRRKATAPANTGRRCTVCACQVVSLPPLHISPGTDQQTPQWRRVMWKGKERDACNKCGISVSPGVINTSYLLLTSSYAISFCERIGTSNENLPITSSLLGVKAERFLRLHRLRLLSPSPHSLLLPYTTPRS